MASKLRNDEILPLSICAEWLGVSKKWLREECRQGRLPYIDAKPEFLLSFNRTVETLQARAQYVPKKKPAPAKPLPTAPPSRTWRGTKVKGYNGVNGINGE